MKRLLAILTLLTISVIDVSAQEPTGFVRVALEDTTFTWKTMDGDGVRIHYQPGSFAERHRAMLMRSVRAATDANLKYFGEPEYPRRLDVFFLNSRDEMERIYGRGVTGLADYRTGGVFLVCNPEWRSFDTHEIGHMVTLGLWGEQNETSAWMREGVAIATDGWCLEYSVDEIAKYLLDKGELPPLREIFGGYSELGEVRGGMYAGSVIDFIRQTYGTEAVRRLWQRGSDHFADAVGASVESVERAWREHLERAVDPTVNVDYERVDDKGCG